jgi:thioesterase domain-containing protein
MAESETSGRSPEELTRITHKTLPFAERTGIRIDVAERGRVRLTMPIEPNVNHVGTMYAGALFTLAEIPGGTMSATTFDPERFFPIVKDIQIRFTRPAVTDISVEVSLTEEEIDALLTEAEEKGKADYSWECELTDTNGTVVAVSKNVYQIRSRDLPMRTP